MSRWRSFSYSRPEHSSGSSRSPSYAPTIHRLPVRRRPSRSRSQSPRRGRRRNISRSRSHSRGTAWSRSPTRYRRYSPSSPSKQARRARRLETKPDRATSRIRSRDHYRRSRSRSRKPLEPQAPRKSAGATTQRGWSPVGTIPQNTLPRVQSNVTGPRPDFEPGKVSPIQARPLFRLVVPSRPKALSFASSVNLNTEKDLSLMSMVTEGAQRTPVVGPSLGPAIITHDRGMEVNNHRRANQGANISMSPTVTEVGPGAYKHPSHINAGQSPIITPANYSIPHMMPRTSRSPSRDPSLACMAQQDTNKTPPIRTSTASSPKDLYESLQELAQAIASLVKFKAGPESGGHSFTAEYEKNSPQENFGYQAYADSAARRCERMIAATANNVMSQVKEKHNTGSGNMKGVEYKCVRCDELEQRIRVLEQQRLDEGALVVRMEKSMGTRFERMIEARVGKKCKEEGSDDVLPPNKRRRNTREMVEARIEKLESIISTWEKHLADVLGTGDPPASQEEGRPKSIPDRIFVLGGRLKAGLGALSSAISLDPSKPLGQGLNAHLTKLRMEMATMITDAFGSLEESLARVIVGVIIKQTKLEMQANYENFAKELHATLASDSQAAKGKEPAWLPNIEADAQASGLGSFAWEQSDAPGLALPTIRELPSIKK